MPEGILGDDKFITLSAASILEDAALFPSILADGLTIRAACDLRGLGLAFDGRDDIKLKLNGCAYEDKDNCARGHEDRGGGHGEGDR